MDTIGRLLMIGEDNPYGSDPEWALYCYPPGCSGHRLRRILGLPEDQYLSIHRTNLCDSAWTTKRARERAFELLSPQAPWRVIVLLGRKVTETFEKAALEGVPLVPFATRTCCPGMTLVSLPHPSGRNSALWTHKARDRAREIMRALVPELPWGSADAEEAAA
jgi:uracil-DNA glycosylase